MDSLEKTQSSYLFISLPQKSLGFLSLFFKKEEKKSSTASHLKATYTIKCILTSMRYVESYI